MPEGPEVKCISDILSQNIENYKITKIKIRCEREGKFDLPQDKLLGSKIQNVFSIGKKIFFQLSHGYIMTSLSMTGKWLLFREEGGARPIVSFFLKNKKKEKEIHYYDIRTLGNVSYLDEDEFQRTISSLGTDFLNDSITFSEFKEIISKQNAPLYRLLIDQEKISGIGNYLRCDILYSSRIDPFMKGIQLNEEQLFSLYESCKEIIYESYRNKGFSISNGKMNYMLPDGTRGKYRARIYGKERDDEGREVKKWKQNKGSQTLHYVSFDH